MNNKVVLKGNLVKAFEVKKGKSKKYANNVIAVDKKWVGKDGKWKKKTEFIPFTLWEKLAEKAAAKFKKGSKVEIIGQLVKKGKSGLELSVLTIK